MEMMVVVAIIIVLGGIAVVAYTSFSERGNDARIGADIRAIDTAIGEFYLEYNQFPDSIEQLSATNVTGRGVLLEAKHLRDPWGELYGYDKTGTHNVAAGNLAKPDVYCSRENWVIGNFTNYKKVPK